MNIFVTVGHTYYNALFQAVNEQLSSATYHVVNQISDGDYLPDKHEYFTFTDNIEAYIDQADLVITHAGAGSVFHLLEIGKPIVVVPNFERIDAHQKDLANFVERNNYASVCNNLNQLAQCVIEASSKTFSSYQTDPFCGYQRVLDLLNSSKSRDFEDYASHNQHNGNRSYDKQNIEHQRDSNQEELVAGLSIKLFNSMEDAVGAVISPQGQVISGSAIAINPEKIIKAREDKFINDILLSATIRFADGIGVVKTLSRKSGKKITRIPGCELWEEVMKKASEHQLPVFLIGAKPEIIEQTKDKLVRQYGVNVCGYQNGYFNSVQENELIERLVELKPSIVSVALGSPRQEVLINRCRERCPDTFFMGVGGTYDVYTNNVKRAPKLFRALNLEWFYRLASQPTRFNRQLNLINYLYLELFRKL
jgi:UDP-N-acetyl-D-mannosaminouronate:lipid I N-acetyl-D-mannosaminouronosyltransferase